LWQLGNLAHTTNEAQPNYALYMPMLKQLALVKVGAMLVNLALHDNPSDKKGLDDNNDASIHNNNKQQHQQ